MKKKLLLFLMFLGIVITEGCTNLEEEVLDESLTGGVNPSDVANGTLVAAYSILPGLFQHTTYFALQEISTDEAILPYRGGTDWGDNLVYIDLHRHNYTSAHARINDVWNSISLGSSRALTAIIAIPGTNDANAAVYLAEARGLRAYYSMLFLDLFGVVFKKEDPNANSEVLRGNDAVEYIASELLAIENQVSAESGPGRISQGAVWGLLARLYLNAPVYRDPYADAFSFTTDDMNKVIEYTNKIINSGKYQLSSEYFEIFDDENHTNKELIFAVDQRAELNGHNRMAYFSLSGDQFPLPAVVDANGTDGPAITPDFFQSWEDAYNGDDPADHDPRFFKENLIIPGDSCMEASEFEINRGILRGQQYGLLTTAKGQPFTRCNGTGYKIGKLRNITRADKTRLVNFTLDIDFSPAGSGYSNGYRVEKYEFSKKTTDGRNKGDADIMIIRLADAYLMRAEAKLRTNDPDGALEDVNIVRASRTARGTAPPELTEPLTLDLLFRERGFEFYWEMLRRTDMIRFGKYEDTWTEKTDNNKLKRIFPIPQAAVDGATIIPGYLIQNEGY